MLMMWALKVSRSTTAAARRGSVKVVAPFAERGVGGARDGGPFLPVGDDLEQQFGAAGVELDVAELVQAEQVQAAVAADDAGELFVVGGFGELVDQGRGGDVADPAALLRRRRCPAR